MKTEITKLVIFRLGADLFGADIFSVERVLRHEAASVVPDLPEWIVGVLEHRGTVMPVVDMRRRLGLPTVAPSAETRTMVLATQGGWIGAEVDAVLEVANVPASAMTAPPPLFRGLAAEFVRGVAKVGGRLVVVLEMERVLTSADRILFERALEAEVAAPRG
jgi:purine-binding chemotaxis protein CheW